MTAENGTRLCTRSGKELLNETRKVLVWPETGIWDMTVSPWSQSRVLSGEWPESEIQMNSGDDSLVNPLVTY